MEENVNQEETTQQNVVEEKTPEEKLKLLFETSVKKWFDEHGDLTHRLNYDELDKDSLVYDIGGFYGEWTSNIYSKYNCKVHVFEPVRHFYHFLKSRYDRNKKIQVFNYGFGKEQKNEIISVINDGSSFYRNHKDADSVEIVSVVNFNEHLDQIDGMIDLMKINIEGSEYEILESISDENLKKIKNIQVQFHTFMNNCVERREKIRERLAKTHKTTYEFDFVWENWKLIEEVK